MERKIGEIFEYNGEWYQCVIGYSCNDCAFNNDNCEERERITLKNKLTKEEVTGLCTSELRSDGKSVIFKKLEKVGEPYEYYLGMGIIMVQEYILANANYICEYSQDVVVVDCQNGKVAIEIKQNKEDMEEDREYSEEEFKNNPRFQHHKPIEQVSNMKKMKPFDLKEAKAGKPVCTRDGHKARIICFDLKNEGYPIVAAIGDDSSEILLNYTINGEIVKGACNSPKDLMMLTEKKEGWVNICRNLNTNKIELDTTDVYNTKEEALQNLSSMTYVKTVKIQWEE